MSDLLTPMDLAKVAYRAYGESTGFKNYQGLPMPEWDKLTVSIQTAWVAASQAVISAYRDGIIGKYLDKQGPQS